MALATEEAFGVHFERVGVAEGEGEAGGYAIGGRAAYDVALVIVAAVAAADGCLEVVGVCRCGRFREGGELKVMSPES